LNKVSEHISDHHLKQYFENKFKVPVESVRIATDKPTIVFGPEILGRAIQPPEYRDICNALRIFSRQEP